MAYQIKSRPISPKVKRVKNPKYLRWIREQPCAIPGCKREDVEAAHTGRAAKGMGVKTHDLDCIPLCGMHHRSGNRPESYHSTSEAIFEEFHEINLAEIRARLRKQYVSTHPEAS